MVWVNRISHKAEIGWDGWDEAKLAEKSLRTWNAGVVCVCRPPRFVVLDSCRQEDVSDWPCPELEPAGCFQG